MENNMERKGGLGKSIDILREDVQGMAEDITELYELDNDNFHRTQNLQKALDQANNRINHLTKQVRSNHGKVVFGFIGFAGLIWFGKKVLDHFDRRIEALENPDTEKKEEKAEESDG